MQLVSLTSSFSELASSVRNNRASVESSVGRLSSGNRIVRAADDVAGLSVATRLTTRTNSLRSVLTNLAQADSFLQVADNALNNIHDILQRMTQIAVMANSGTVSSNERSFLNIEFQGLREEIDHILATTEFNGIKIFGGIQGIQETEAAEEEEQPISSLADIIGLGTGDYEIDTGTEQFTGHIDNDGTDSWLLVGRGRENWEFDGDGQGTTDSVITGLGTSAAFAPAAYDPNIINDLLANAGVDLTDVEIRFKRAANTTGTEYQEARWRPISQTAWTWDFDGANYAVEHEVFASSLGAAFSDADSLTRDTLSTPGADTANNYQRIWTFNWPGKGNIPGFSYGSAVAGTDGNDPNTFLWENTAENHATPYTEVYIRLKNPPAAPTTPDPIDADSLDDLNNLFIWLDGNDLDGDGVAEGAAENGVVAGAVTSWANKVGGVAALQGAGASQPTYTTGLNGNSVVQFDGINDWLGLNLNTPESDYTEFVVFNSTDASGAFTTVTNPVSNTAGSHDRQFGLNAGRMYNRLWNTEIITSAATYNDGQGYIASITVDSTSGQAIEVDSTQVAAGVKTSSDFNFDQGFVIGGHSHLGPYQGDIAEVIMFDRVLTAEEYEIVEGYLAHKWGLTANLPNGHAYKTVSPFAPQLDTVNFTLSEDALDETRIGFVAEDLPEGSSYSISSGNDDNIFSIDFRTGELILADNSLIDYETTQSYELTVTITNGDTGQVTQQPVVVNISDVDESRVTFQIDVQSLQKLSVSVAKLDTEQLFGGLSPDVLTQENAVAAFDIVKHAIDQITSKRAYYGSLQSSVTILADAKSTELRNQDEARGVVEDTDMARTSTDYATQLSKSQASISIAAQTNQLRSDTVLGILEDGIQL